MSSSTSTESDMSSPESLPPLPWGEWDRNWSPIFMLVLVSVVFHSGVSLAMFHSRRTKFPISGHSQWLVTILVSSVTVLAALFAAAGAASNALPCFFLLMFAVFSLTTLNCVLARAVRIFFHYSLANERVKSSDSKSRWFNSHASWFSERRLVVILLLFSAIEAGALVATFFADPSYGELLMHGCGSIELALRVGDILAGVKVLEILYTTFRIRNIRDNYGIKKDIGISSILVLYFIAIHILNGVLFEAKAHGLLFCLGAHALVFNVCTLKVYKSHQSDRDRELSPFDKQMSMFNEPSASYTGGGGSGSYSVKKHADEDDSSSICCCFGSAFCNGGMPKGHAPRNENLSVVFRDADLFAEFQEHLKTEFSVENLLFCQAAQEFLEKSVAGEFSSAKEANDTALQIYTEYVHEKAPSQVNLSSQFSLEIAQQLARCNADFDPFATSGVNAFETMQAETQVPALVFEDARKEIYSLMERDTFVRFKSEKYRSGQRLLDGTNPTALTSVAPNTTRRITQCPPSPVPPPYSGTVSRQQSLPLHMRGDSHLSSLGGAGGFDLGGAATPPQHSVHRQASVPHSASNALRDHQRFVTQKQAEETIIAAREKTRRQKQIAQEHKDGTNTQEQQSLSRHQQHHSGISIDIGESGRGGNQAVIINPENSASPRGSTQIYIGTGSIPASNIF